MQIYGNEFARYYDLILYGVDEMYAGGIEMEFFRKIVESRFKKIPRNVLDAGCGTGRMAVPLAAEGYSVTGIDTSLDMLDICRKKLKDSGQKTELLQEDIAKIDFTNKFDMIICIDSVICYSLKPEKILEILKKFKKALKPGGIVVIENWNMYNKSHLINNELKYMKEGEEARVAVIEKSFYDYSSKVLTIELVAEAAESGEKHNFSHRERLFIPSFGEMKIFLEDAGFQDIETFSGFDMKPESDTAGDNMIYVAARGKER